MWKLGGSEEFIDLPRSASEGEADAGSRPRAGGLSAEARRASGEVASSMGGGRNLFVRSFSGHAWTEAAPKLPLKEQYRRSCIGALHLRALPASVVPADPQSFHPHHRKRHFLAA